MVFPETTRALALSGADIVFHLTMGGASMAGGDASIAAFRTRAADNFIYLVVAFRGGGSMVISPKGEILADGGREPDAIVAADIEPASGRDAGDALGGITSDFRARLFRERVPAAYGILMEAYPPILEKLKDIPVPSSEEAAALFAEGLTTGADAFYEAERWLAEGKVEEASIRFEELAKHTSFSLMRFQLLNTSNFKIYPLIYANVREYFCYSLRLFQSSEKSGYKSL